MDYTKLLFDKYQTALIRTQQVSEITGRRLLPLKLTDAMVKVSHSND